MSRNREIAILILIIAAGIALRTWNLGARSYWFDEMQTAISATQPPLEAVKLAAAQERKTPLFHLIMHPWLAVSRDETWARIPAAFFGVLAIPFAWLLAREFARKGKAAVPLMTAAIVAFNPALIYYSQQLRMYSALGAFSLLNMYFFIRVMRAFSAGEADRERAPAAKMTAWFLVTGLICSLIHPFYAFLAAAEAIVSLVWLLPRWDKALGMAVISVFAAGPGMAVLIMRMGGASKVSEVFQPVRLLALLNVFRHMAVMFPTPRHGMAWHEILTVGAAVAVSGALFVLGAIAARPWRVKAALLMFVLTPISIMFDFSRYEWPIVTPRFLMNVFPVFSLLAALGIAHLPRAAWRAAALAAALGLSLVSIGYYNFDKHYYYADTRALSAYLREHADARPVIHTSYSTYFSSYFYDEGRLNEYILTPEPLAWFRGGEMLQVCRPGARMYIEGVVKPDDDFYLVVPEPVEYWQDGKPADQALSRFIGGNYEVLGRERFWGATVYRVKRLS